MAAVVQVIQVEQLNQLAAHHGKEVTSVGILQGNKICQFSKRKLQGVLCSIHPSLDKNIIKMQQNCTILYDVNSKAMSYFLLFS